MTSEPHGRRPYLLPFRRDWWLQLRFYRLYMLREATVLPLLFFVGCLIYGLYSLGQGPLQWQQWLGTVVVAISLLVLLGGYL